MKVQILFARVNHFHLLVKVDDEAEVVISTPDRVLNPVRGNVPSQQFSKLFNSYAQAFNKRFSLRGSLFERPFKRKLIDNKTHLKNVVLYIHYNPIHHGFCSHPMEYPWSSYLTCVSIKPTKLLVKQSWVGLMVMQIFKICTMGKSMLRASKNGWNYNPILTGSQKPVRIKKTKSLCLHAILKSI